MIPPYPEIESVVLPKTGQTTAFLGDTIELDGHDLDGSNLTLLLANTRAAVAQTRPAASATASVVKFGLPIDPVGYPAGIYGVTLQVQRPGDPATRLTLSNEVAMAIAPQITSFGKAVNAAGDLVVTPTCQPQVRPTQRVSLILGDREVIAEPFNLATPTPSFVFSGLPNGTYWMRLRVDGADSPLIDRSVSPPVFNAPQVAVP